MYKMTAVPLREEERRRGKVREMPHLSLSCRWHYPVLPGLFDFPMKSQKWGAWLHTPKTFIDVTDLGTTTEENYHLVLHMTLCVCE